MILAALSIPYKHVEKTRRNQVLTDFMYDISNIITETKNPTNRITRMNVFNRKQQQKKIKNTHFVDKNYQ